MFAGVSSASCLAGCLLTAGEGTGVRGEVDLGRRLLRRCVLTSVNGRDIMRFGGMCGQGIRVRRLRTLFGTPSIARGGYEFWAEDTRGEYSSVLSEVERGARCMCSQLPRIQEITRIGFGLQSTDAITNAA